MKRKPPLLSPLFAAFLIASLALPPQSALALRVRNAGLEEPTAVTNDLEGKLTGKKAYRIDPNETAKVVIQALAAQSEPVGTRSKGNRLLTLNYSQVSALAGGRPTPQAISKSANELSSDTWLKHFNHALGRILDPSYSDSDLKPSLRAAISTLRERGITQIQVPVNPRPNSGD